MVEREARNGFSQLLRHFASGRINEEIFEQTYLSIRGESKDPALNTIYEAVLFKIALKEEWLPREVARWILFLQSDDEYEWPVGPSEAYSLLLVPLVLVALCPAAPTVVKLAIWASLGTWFFLACCWWRQIKIGDENFWPFYRQKDFEKAIKTPRLLNGNRENTNHR